MVSYRTPVRADPGLAWELLSRPARWHEWAPHIRGAWGLGEPEVEQGRRGAVRLGGFVPVPVQITAKRPGESWTWQAGPYSMEHRIEAHPGGCDVVIEVTAAAPLERALRASYGHLIELLLRRFAAVAAGKPEAR